MSSIRDGLYLSNDEFLKGFAAFLPFLPNSGTSRAPQSTDRESQEHCVVVPQGASEKLLAVGNQAPFSFPVSRHAHLIPLLPPHPHQLGHPPQSAAHWGLALCRGAAGALGGGSISACHCCCQGLADEEMDWSSLGPSTRAAAPFPEGVLIPTLFPFPSPCPLPWALLS